jgi:hypothetical protein
LGLLLIACVCLAAPVGAASAAKKQGKSAHAAAATKDSARQQTLRLPDDGALGYDWTEWRSVAGARDGRLQWRLRVTSSVMPDTGKAIPDPAGAPLSQLFREERSTTRMLITDTPLHRDGLLSVALRVEF